MFGFRVVVLPCVVVIGDSVVVVVGVCFLYLCSVGLWLVLSILSFLLLVLLV